MIYRQDYYEGKLKEIYDLFIEYSVPIMDDIDHTELIKECEQNIDVYAYENNLNQYEKIPSIRKTINRYNRNEFLPAIINESLNWLLF